MNSKFVKSAALAALMSVVAIPAMAQMAAPAPMPAFADMDTNKDGMLTKEEMTAATSEAVVGRAFDPADANKDGNITEEEWKNKPAPAAMAMG
jgi:hypothetical protein